MTSQGEISIRCYPLKIKFQQPIVKTIDIYAAFNLNPSYKTICGVERTKYSFEVRAFRFSATRKHWDLRKFVPNAFFIINDVGDFIQLPNAKKLKEDLI